MDDPVAAKTVMHGDLLCKTLSFLEWTEVVNMRLVAKSWKEAVGETPVEEQILVETQLALQGLRECLPKLQSLKMDQRSELSQEHLLLYNFSNIQHFHCLHTTPSLLQPYDLQRLLGLWQNLRSLNLHGNEDLEWKLSDLASLAHLRDLRCINNRCLRGDTQDLLLQSCNGKLNVGNSSRTRTEIFYNLIILDISGCTQVVGKLRDFCQLPHLQWLGINRTQVTGDLRRDIMPGDFVALQGMGLCSRAVYGASEIQSVRDAEAVMRARLQIMKQSTWECPVYPLMVHLSPTSADYHERVEQRLYSSELDPPFSIETVVVAKRWGWRWSNYLGGFCDTHWLDPEPTTDCNEYQNEFAEFQREKSTFSGFLDPPTREQYRLLFWER